MLYWYLLQIREAAPAGGGGVPVAAAPDVRRGAGGEERLASSASRQRSELDKLQRQLEDTTPAPPTCSGESFEKAREEQERRHTVSLLFP